jgi:glycosyltransferase 2 family protein
VKFRIALIAALGLGLAFYLVAYVGLGSVLSAAVAVGWSGFAILCLYVLGLYCLLGAAWYPLLPASSPAGLWVFVWARMVRDAATEVLPFSQLGGIVLGARAAILHGVSRPYAFASMIVDVTAELLAQIAYIALGVVILSGHAPRTPFAMSLTTIFMIGLALAVLAGGVFLALQRYGHRIIGRIAARLLPSAGAATAAEVGVTLDAIYRAPLRVGLSATLHFGGWIASAIGTWIAFRLIGVRVDLTSVLAIESFVCAARSAAVIVPNALGVQEAAYAVLAPLFGIGAEFGLAVSLLKRARDLAVGVPILLIWQAVEGRRAFALENESVGVERL